MASADPTIVEPTRDVSRVSRGWYTMALLAAITFAGLGLRLFRLDLNSYWHDEVISTFLARIPAAEIFRSVTISDSHPPLYHILLHYWGAIFSYELVPLRLLSVALSVLCVPLTFQLGRVLAGPPVGLVAAALMAVAPFQIFHGQQARMYPLLTLMVLLAILTFWSAWGRGGVWRWALFGLVAAAGFYTHVYFYFSLFALDLWALYESVRQRRLDWRRWAGLVSSQVLAVALFVPFVMSMYRLTSSVVGGFWIPRSTGLEWMYALVEIVNGGQAGGAASLRYLVVSFLPAIGAFLLAVIVAARASRQSPDERRAWELLVFTVLVPCAVATMLSLKVQSILVSRSLIGLSGPLFVLLAWAAVRLWARRLTWAVGLAVVLSMAVGLTVAYPASYRPHSLDPAVAYLFEEREPGDAIILLDWQSFDLVALRHPEAADVYVGSPEESVANWQARMAVMRWHTPAQVGPPEGYAGRYRRVWVLQTPYTYLHSWDATGPWLAQHGRVVREQAFSDGRALLYELGE